MRAQTANSAGHRVVVTGIGAVSALGSSAKELWAALAAGRSGIGSITSVPPSEGLHITRGAEVRNFDPSCAFDKKSLELLDRFAQLFVVAAREAVDDSGIEWSDGLRERTAVITGASHGGILTEDRQYHALYKQGQMAISPLIIPRGMSNAGASRVSMELGTTGPGFTLSTACSSSNHAIGLAFWMVRMGVADAAVTGGSEAPFCFGNLKAWQAVRTVAPDTCRPFSKDRQGMILGEGGAALMLETLDAALARGATIHGEIAGFGMSCDAHHITQPSSAGAVRAMRAALDDAALLPEDIDYINAHGTGTVANDVSETRAIRTVFGEHATRLAVTSTKSMHGHTLGAAGAIEAAATLLAMRQNVVPPTANYRERDPECDLDVVPNEARPMHLRAALSNSFAFGGLNAVLAFRRWEGG